VIKKWLIRSKISVGRSRRRIVVFSSCVETVEGVVVYLLFEEGKVYAQ
jgi:hypothetical protein